VSASTHKRRPPKTSRRRSCSDDIDKYVFSTVHRFDSAAHTGAARRQEGYAIDIYCIFIFGYPTPFAHLGEEELRGSVCVLTGTAQSPSRLSGKMQYFLNQFGVGGVLLFVPQIGLFHKLRENARGNNYYYCS
jgi:hypothetical protein